MKSFFHHPSRLLIGLLVATAGLTHAQPTPPTVSTFPASAVGVTNATLNGTANPFAEPTSGWFQWGTTTNYGNVTPAQPLGSGFGNTNFSQVVGGLLIATTYHFRAVATNADGIGFGTNQSFTTPPFMDIGAGLLGVARGAVAWGDYDNDGRLDFILTGATNINSSGVVLGAISHVWRNTTNGFTNVTSLVAPDLPGVARGSVAWGDYDNDGRLDFLLTGYTPAAVYYSQIWRNTGAGFTNVTAILAPGLIGVAAGSVAWGDYDHDGRLDFLLTGYSPGVGNVSQLWRNTGSGFTNATLAATSGLGLTGVEYSSVSWVDYDHDGWLDFLLMGVTNNNLLVLDDGRGLAQLWRNTGQTFVDVTTSVLPGLPALVVGSAAWGDADNDGRPDLLVTGYIINTGRVAQVWRNTGGAFTNLNAGLPGVYFGSVAWGDYDNDGRPDILLTGGGASGNLGQVWRNTGGSFTNLNAGLPGVEDSSVAWADFDNDGRLDFLLTGATNSFAQSNFVSQVWRNSSPVTNTPPSAPTGLAMTVSAQGALLSWNSSTDAQTPSTGLSYNVRAGTTPGGTNLIAAHVDGATGFRRVPALGNAQLLHSLPLAGVTNGQIVYWSVQAVDSAFAGGPFATETSVVSLPQLSITPGGATNAIVSWKPPTWGWHLQESTNLATVAWGDSPSGELNPATLPAAPQRYYRLRWP